MPLFLVSTISKFKHTYTVEADSLEEAEAYFDKVIDTTEIAETSQEFEGETVYNVKRITEKEFIKYFDKGNDYLAHLTKEEKLRYINKEPKNV